MTASKILLYFCLAFIGGVFLNSIARIPQLTMLGILILGILLISVFWKYRKFIVVGFCLLFLVFGIWRHQGVEVRSLKSELRSSNDRGENITLIGIVGTEPDIREKSIKLIIQVKNITNPKCNEKCSRYIDGEVLVNANRYPEYRYGDKLKIIGRLETPSEDINGFNYKNYLKKDGIYSVMNWPEIELIDSGFGNPLMKLLYSFKDKFQETSRKFVPPPQEGLLEALIFGDESNISKELKDKFNLTGTRHITAVSGMNITIIASLILTFALSLGLWRQQAFFLSIFLLVLYILMIGVPSSAVRAGIMAGILMTGQYFGRLSSAGRPVIFAACLMLLINPFLLLLDVGFQLSFLAILGIIYLQPVFSNLLKIFPNSKFFPLRTTISTTLSAQVFTLPILVYNFGYIPIVSPITNILIVPFLAPITILIFLFGLAGMIFGPFGFIFSFPVWISLAYIIKTIEWFSNAPYVSLALKNIHWVWPAISYFILGLFVLWLRARQKLKFLNY